MTSGSLKRPRSAGPLGPGPSNEELPHDQPPEWSSAKKGKKAVQHEPEVHALEAAMHARAKSTLTFSHEAFESKEMEAGEGLRYHEFSNVSFSHEGAANGYIQATGLEPIGTEQRWGLLETVRTSMYRSRRGSLSGFAVMEDQTVKGWRLHSLATSEALRAKAVDANQFQSAFDERAQRLMLPAVNTRGTQQSVNTVLSDVGKVRFNHDSFEVFEATHAMGVSGSGVDSKASSSPQSLYAPSIEVAKAEGKKAPPALTYHSEPMAMTLHNGARATPTENDSDLIAAFASFPNQVCAYCNRMFQQKMGTDSVVAASSGRPFVGQKEGAERSTTGTTVIRAAPMSELWDDHAHRSQIASIYEHHRRW